MCKTMNISKKRIAVNSIAHTVYLHFEPPKILNDLNDRDLNDRNTKKMTASSWGRGERPFFIFNF